jgi:hypothetical protein
MGAGHAGAYYLVGLKEDGTVVATGCVFHSAQANRPKEVSHVCI